MSATRQLEFFPAAHPGKWHIDSLGVSLCGSVEIDRASGSGPIVVTGGDDRFHPMCCRRCISAAKAGQR